MACSSPAVFLLFSVSACLFLSAIAKNSDTDVTKCEVCRTLVNGFEKGLKRTARLNFAGGDVSWEEEKKLSYSTSETRLLEIMEQACDHDHKYKCQLMLEEQEELLEKWWFKKRSEDKDLLTWLCISYMEVCCANNTYGENCKPCPGGIDNPCGGFGTCDGTGDRKGSGKCFCNAGYTGPSCGECNSAYYDVDNSSAIKCEPCHSSCALNCTGTGPGDCDDCKSGWKEENDVCQDVDECAGQSAPCHVTGKYCSNTEGSYLCLSCNKACADNCTAGDTTSCRNCAGGYQRDNLSSPCLDVNECAVNESLCSTGTYCKNTDGSFTCKACNAACSDGCSGPGPDHCTSCAVGYELHSSTCTDIDECQSSPCDKISEDCHNAAGTYSCECKKGFDRADNRCKKRPERSDDEEDEEGIDDDDDDDDDDNDGDSDKNSAENKKTKASPDENVDKDEL